MGGFSEPLADPERYEKVWDAANPWLSLAAGDAARMKAEEAQRQKIVTKSAEY